MPELRKYRIAKILISAKEILRIDDVAEKMLLSPKSIRNALPDVEKVISGYELKLVKKPGTGIYIEGSDANKLRFLTVNNPANIEKEDYSSKIRQLIIIDMLLSGKPQHIYIGYLEDIFYISRPSIYKDLEEVKNWFAANEIEVVTSRDKGIFIKGGEKRIRHAMFDLLIAKEQCGDFDFLLSGKSTSYTELISDFVKAAFGVIKPELMQKTVLIVQKIEHEFGVKLFFNDLKRLTKCLFVAFWRIKNGNFCTMRHETMNELATLPSFAYMGSVASYIEQSLDIALTDCEKFYIFGDIVSVKSNKNIELYTSRHFLSMNRGIAKKIVAAVTKKFYIRNEEKFYEEMVALICSIGNKINYGLDFYNPLEYDILQKFPHLMGIIESAHYCIKEAYCFDVPRGELCYIVLLTAAVIEHSKRMVNAIIIYDCHDLEVQYMVEKIKNNINQIKIAGLYPVYMMDKLDYSQIDMMILTNQIDGLPNIRKVIIPTIPTNDDLLSLYRYTIEVYEEINNQFISKNKGV